MDALFEQPLALYAALVLVTVVLPTIKARALAGAGLLLAALGIAADRVATPGAGSTFATTNEILVGVGTGIVILAAIFAWRWRRLEHGQTAGITPGYVLDPLLLAGLLLATLGPHLILVASGIFLALVSAAAAALRARRARWTAMVVLAGTLLGCGFFLLFTILGPDGGRVREISAGPFSPPAERLLTILLGLGSLALVGLFPFHTAPWRLSLAPVAAILLGRVLLPALPEGLADWQAPAMLWLAVAVCIAAWEARWSAAAVAGGLLALWSGRPEGIVPGCALLMLGWLAGARAVQPSMTTGFAGRWWSALWLAAVAAGIPFALGAALQGQVLVSVLGVLGAVAGLLLQSRRAGRAGA